MKKYLEKLEDCFPPLLKIILSEYLYLEICEEIHLSRSGCVFVRLSSSGIKIIDYRLSKGDFDLILKNLCRGSLYAHTESIKQGFISFMDKIRVGVLGKAICSGDKILSVSGIETLNIRIPHFVKNVARPIVDVLEHYSFSRGILIYSPPAVGKTTVLRDGARMLSSFPYYKRVSLIDSRGELDFPERVNCPTLDVYKFYPPDAAIECAVRTMSPEIIICDEIGGARERDALLNLCGKGVTVMASAHGGNILEIMMNNDVALLHKNRVFGCYVELSRNKNNQMGFKYYTYEQVEEQVMNVKHEIGIT